MATMITCSIERNRVVRVLRSRSTRRYFKDEGWTDDPEEATLFSDPLAAAETCTRYGLVDVELALRMPGASCDVYSTTLR